MGDSVWVLFSEGVERSGRVLVQRGTLAGLSGDGLTVDGDTFQVAKSGGRLKVEIADAHTAAGPGATKVTLELPDAGFSFWLRDATARSPIWVRELEVAVTPGGERQSYADVTDTIRAKGLRSRIDQIEDEPEETWEEAAAANRPLTCPTWLGLSRDIRIFEVDHSNNFHNSSVRPRLHGPRVRIGETEVDHNFVVGRGTFGVYDLERRLEEGVLPILDAVRRDDEMEYHMKSFAVSEKAPFTAEALRGTDFLVADWLAFGNMQTPEQQKLRESRADAELNTGEEAVLFTRVEARNVGKVPRYAFFMNAKPNVKWTHNSEKGFCVIEDGRVSAISRYEGGPLPQEEMAVLVQPGDSVTFEFRIPHSPIPAERAEAVAAQSFETRLEECRAFWKQKLASGASIDLPEPRLDEMVKAGLLHLDLVCYGKEPDEPVAATIGHYCPIGSESSPIIQFIDSMGRHDLARRSLHYFLEKQHDDGFIQNFGGYMLETGAALWTMGEHWRYTRDDDWVRSIKDKLLLSCKCIIDWRERNMKEELRGRGYGMCDGKVADPEDPFRQWALNGYAYLGLSRVAEMLHDIDPAEAERIGKVATDLKSDIRESLMAMLTRCPVAPLGDGTWVPTSAPWAEADSAPWMLTDNPTNFTHGAFGLREAALGAAYLMFQEVVDPDEPVARWLNDLTCELFTERNVAPSQPFYSRHPWTNLQRGETRAFIKAWYNGAAGLADRETYSFWEHYFHASPHKTHEEAWFLMQARWMLWQERDETLRLFQAVPRAWLAPGQRVAITEVASYFGPITASLEASKDGKRITARVTCNTDRKPERLEIRVPHPEGRKAKKATGGDYNADAELVAVEGFTGEATVEVEW